MPLKTHIEFSDAIQIYRAKVSGVQFQTNEGLDIFNEDIFKNLFSFQTLDRPSRLGQYFLLIASLLLHWEQEEKQEQEQAHFFFGKSGFENILFLISIHLSCIYLVTRSRILEKGGTISEKGAISSHLLLSSHLLYSTRTLSMDTLQCSTACTQKYLKIPEVPKGMYLKVPGTTSYTQPGPCQWLLFIAPHAFAVQCLRQGYQAHFVTAAAGVGPPGVSLLVFILREGYKNYN